MIELGGAAGGALVTAFVITLLELAEVVAIVYALGATSKSLRPGFLGACGGVALIGALGVFAGIALTHAPETYTLAVGAGMLWGFGFFLLRSTLRTYVRTDRKKRGTDAPFQDPHEGVLTHQQLIGVGFSVGCIEALEAVIVLIAISAGGFPWEAVAGAIAAGVVLVGLGLALHQSIRKIKVPPLKWVTTSLLMTYATFWTWEVLADTGHATLPSLAGLPDDVLLVPIFFVVLLVVRLVVQARLIHVRKIDTTPTPTVKAN